MRKTLRCPKCDGNKLLHLTQVADMVGGPGTVPRDPVDPDPVFQHSLPWRIARVQEPATKMWWVTGNGGQLEGLVEAFICRACGYTEFYTRSPEKISADGAIVVEINGADPEGPFR